MTGDRRGWRGARRGLEGRGWYWGQGRGAGEGLEPPLSAVRWPGIYSWYRNSISGEASVWNNIMLLQGMVDGSASKPALRQDTGF